MIIRHLLGSVCFSLVLLCACTSTDPVDPEAARQQIREAEAAFATMVAEEGMAAGFMHFAADNAVLLRGKKLIGGKDAMQKYFANSPYSDVQLTWQPAYIDVASSGDMGYTYGPYTFVAIDTTGQQVHDTGYFHTVWKKQKDGAWKFVWD